MYIHKAFVTHFVHRHICKYYHRRYNEYKSNQIYFIVVIKHVDVSIILNGQLDMLLRLIQVQSLKHLFVIQLTHVIQMLLLYLQTQHHFGMNFVLIVNKHVQVLILLLQHLQ
jgi:hypothetical protein